MTIVTFDPNFYVARVVLVGAGGTGAQWARCIARMLVDLRARRMNPPEFVIVDPDRVEIKNVGRQLFTAADVGHYKAEILARRFNLSLGLDVAWVNAPFRAREFTSQRVSTLWCGAVDNHQARQELAKVGYGSSYRHLWIDAGNWATGGQVIIGNTDRSQDVRFFETRDGHAHTNWLPVASLLFPSLLQPEPPTPTPQASCAELLAAGEQHLLVNDLMAVAAASYTYRLLNRQSIPSFITYCDLDTLSMRSPEISSEALEAYLQTRPDTEPIDEIELTDEDGRPLDVHEEDDDGYGWDGEWDDDALERALEGEED